MTTLERSYSDRVNELRKTDIFKHIKQIYELERCSHDNPGLENTSRCLCLRSRQHPRRAVIDKDSWWPQQRSASGVLSFVEQCKVLLPPMLDSVHQLPPTVNVDRERVRRTALR